MNSAFPTATLPESMASIIYYFMSMDTFLAKYTSITSSAAPASNFSILTATSPKFLSIFPVASASRLTRGGKVAIGVGVSNFGIVYIDLLIFISIVLRRYNKMRKLFIGMGLGDEP